MPLPSANNVWTIAFGDYELAIDRKALTYRLVETKTGTVWADGLPVGSIEFEDRATGERQTVDFGACKLVSLSEKASAQGKRILFGLDWQGVPIDINVTCSQREIQLIVEASRDTRAHRVQDVTLLPGLCSVPDDGASYMVLPSREGGIVQGRRGVLRENGTLPGDWPLSVGGIPVWDTANGLTMPFVGAVRLADGQPYSALALVTDSAYASLIDYLSGDELSVALRFQRDSERRRLEVRIATLPHGDHISVARFYREKLVAERTHITLKRKIRERPLLDAVIGGAVVVVPIESEASRRHHDFTLARVPEIISVLRDDLGVTNGMVLLSRGDLRDEAHGDTITDSTVGDAFRQVVQAVRKLGFRVGWKESSEVGNALEHLPKLGSILGFDGFYDHRTAFTPLGGSEEGMTRWDEMDRRMNAIAAFQQQSAIFGAGGGCDWSALACDFWTEQLGIRDCCEYTTWAPPFLSVPLYAAVYHDAVISYPLNLLYGSDDVGKNQFLRALLSLCPPLYELWPQTFSMPVDEYVFDTIRRTYAVLAPLHRLSFSSFLNAHRFLTPDFLVEEARYTNGARVVINQSETDDYEAEDLHLPPLGFYVEHPQMVAHDARRVRAESFPTRAWRIARSRDDKPLAESADVLRQEFPVEGA